MLRAGGDEDARHPATAQLLRDFAGFIILSVAASSMFAQSVSTKSIATYQVESKLIEIKEVAAFLLIFSLLSFPDLFVLIPGCILACKWVNCACCGCKCAPPDQRVAAQERRRGKQGDVGLWRSSSSALRSLLTWSCFPIVLLSG